MKILHLTGDHEDTGGVLSVIRNLQEGGQALSWSHHVWVHQAFVETRHPKLAYLRSPFICSDSPNHGRLFIGAIRGWWKLRPLLRSGQYDIIHAHTRGALLVALMLATIDRRKVIFTNHNYANQKWLYRQAATCPGMYTVLLTRNMARHYGFDGHESRMSIISACFNDRILEAQLRLDDGGEKTKLCFMGMGSILPWKKWDLLIRAVGLLPDHLKSKIRVEIWGPTCNTRESSDYRKHLENLIAQLMLQETVALCGVTNKVPEHLVEADWFVLPSTNEPCSVALLEALAVGVPALVSQSGGNIDIVKEGVSGCFFAPDDPHSLASQMAGIIKKQRGVSSARAIRESVRPFSARSVLEKYGGVYSIVLRAMGQQ